MSEKVTPLLIIVGVTALTFLGVMFMLPAGHTSQSAIIGVAMCIVMAVAIIMVNKHGETAAARLRAVETELRQTRDELSDIKVRYSEVTTTDDLTGCSNRRYYLELLNQHRAMADRTEYEFTVAVLQVDQFASIVEEYGLGEGNEVLQLFARIVKAALREVDVIARFNADIFGLVLSGATEADSLNIIDRISSLISQIQVNDAHEITITASGGITVYHGAETAEELIEHAEEALQFAIEQGRDRVAGYNYVEPVQAALDGDELNGDSVEGNGEEPA
ncbi:MAG: GGDEF domain-containing protein [Pseudomonadales bacterium]|nr:GGDEF domain-containing protein [Pseudomonadales bacterium]